MINRNNLRDYGLLILGAVVQAASMALFLIPGQIASGGVSGLSIVLHHYTGLPIGMMVLVMNVPQALHGEKKQHFRLVAGPHVDAYQLVINKRSAR
jgi:uncharacterized membrane-anchored protein YitT (DUF2179 family)